MNAGWNGAYIVLLQRAPEPAQCDASYSWVETQGKDPVHGVQWACWLEWTEMTMMQWRYEAEHEMRSGRGGSC